MPHAHRSINEPSAVQLHHHNHQVDKDGHEVRSAGEIAHEHHMDHLKDRQNNKMCLSGLVLLVGILLIVVVFVIIV